MATLKITQIGNSLGLILPREIVERLRLAKSVWSEFKANNSENCQHCHRFNDEVVAKQKDFVRPMHQQFLSKAATCIDCHKGVAHTAPDE